MPKSAYQYGVYSTVRNSYVIVNDHFVVEDNGPQVSHGGAPTLFNSPYKVPLFTQDIESPGYLSLYFPDTDPAFAGADSRVLLREVAKRVRAAGFSIGNIDATIIAQAPKMAPHVPAMVERIASDLGIAPGCVNVKAKTTERLGFTGRGEGIATEAIALVFRA